ncbi:MAG: carboxymuconolactone decarboxylase family protein, partial [Gemmatimonadaceae bacterium]
MTDQDSDQRTFSPLDEEHVALVRVAAAIAASDESTMRVCMARAADVVRASWMEEVVLQSYLFAGFPRALNAAREWRKASGIQAPVADEGERFIDAAEWAVRGEETCAVVYGVFYEPLRRNIRALHPALDAWMITEGYGKVLSRPQLDLKERELCVVAACAAAGQDRQLHSHLHGALNAGASPHEVGAVLDALIDLMTPANYGRYRQLLVRVVNGNVH